ncbi:MAG: FxLYD domain-containing protein, partial [Thermoleophilia bacterium]|nr:FxLYD domain-containing protein [Thermoleophilia bacterium]
ALFEQKEHRIAMQRPVPIALLLALGFGALFPTGCSVFTRVELADDIWLANRRYNQKRYMVARAMYARLIEEYPDGRTRQKLMLKMGRCSFNEDIRSLHDARMTYMEYLDAYPEGHYAKDARDNLLAIDFAQAERQRMVEIRQGKVAKRIEEIQEAIKKDPENTNLYGNADLHLQLGNALWNLGSYDEACKAYLKSCQIDPTFKENDLVKRRVVFDEKGLAIALTPNRRQAIAREMYPLVVFDTYDYTSRMTRSLYNAGQAYFNVTGFVRNQSAREIKGVVVEVRFYDPGRKLLDSVNVHVGNMRPGTVRPFRARATSFDNLYNISRYECYPDGQ